MNEKWLLISGITSITFIGLVVGLVLILTQSIRLDEAQTMWIASKSLTEAMKLTGEDVHVPMYNSLAHIVIKLFGNDVRYVRGMSLFFYGLSIPSLYILVKENLSKKAGVLAAGLLAFSPFVVWFSAEARMYSLLLWVTIVNNIFFLKFVKSNGRLGKLGYFLSGVGGIFSHYFFWLNIMSQGLYLVLKFSQQWWGQKKLTKKYEINKKVYFVFGLACLGWIITLAPWVVHAISLGGASNTQPLITRPTSYNIVVAVVNFLFGFHENNIQNILVSLWPLTALGLLVAFSKKNLIRSRNIDYFAIAAILPIIVVYLLSMIRPIFLSRYLMFVVPSWMAILGWVVADQKKWLSTATITIMIGTMSGLLVNQTISAQTPVKENYRELTDYLEENANGSDIVAISPPFTVYPIEYSYNGLARLTTIPEWDRYIEGSIPAFEEAKLVNQITEMKKIYQSVFVVLTYDQGYEDTIRSYMDNNYELIDKKTLPADIEVRRYKLRY